MKTLHFSLTTEHIALNQLLKLLDLCHSGGGGKALVAQGLVSVDGLVETRKTAKIRSGQTVVCGQNQILVAAAVH